MTLIELREKLRIWLNQTGIFEIPQYPVALFSGWHHPDIMLSLFEEGSTRLFSFQMLEERSLCSGEPLRATPGLIMVIKPYTPDFLSRIVDFFSVLSELTGGSPSNSFAFQASQGFERILGERGSSCDLSYNGVVCGNLTILSEILSIRLKEPAVLVSLDLARFLRCSSAESMLNPIQWSDVIIYDSFFAVDAYLADISSKTSPSALLQQLEKISSADNASVAFNGVIRMLLQFKSLLSCNLKLSGAFVDVLKKIVCKKHELNESHGRKEVVNQ